ncbi:hypothetical protein BS47DRAFT_1368952 [Hydnum rufescens UP504]|uniref:Uncharacterized protein n=1 Tax=Hydnum rufescens UP504 TaxID=1448309 RepID=A0A9P6AFY7_9AGAM|nr:hypothetical protein BS47DRAFT_1368952 [Hydnum rufescens UP504]
MPRSWQTAKRSLGAAKVNSPIYVAGSQSSMLPPSIPLIFAMVGVPPNLTEYEDVKFFVLMELHHFHDLVNNWKHHTAGLLGRDGGHGSADKVEPRLRKFYHLGKKSLKKQVLMMMEMGSWKKDLR